MISLLPASSHETRMVHMAVSFPSYKFPFFKKNKQNNRRLVGGQFGPPTGRRHIDPLQPVEEETPTNSRQRGSWYVTEVGGVETKQRRQHHCGIAASGGGGLAVWAW